MGSTQLLLLVLAVIVVSISVIIGVQLYSERMTNSNFDSLLEDAITIATNAQAWKNTPQLLGGSPDVNKTDPYDYSGANFVAIGYSVDKMPRCYSNENGLYAITPTDLGLRITASSTSSQNRLIVLVRGAADGQIVVQDGPLTSQRTVKGGYFVDSGEPTRVYKPVECSGRVAGLRRGP